MAFACLTALVWMLGVARQERRLSAADAALSAGRPAQAVRLAASATGPTVGGRAARTLAAAALERGDLPEAERQIGRAVRLAPDDWSLHRDHAVLLQRLGFTAAARTEIRGALRLNPRLDLPPGFSLARPGRTP